MLHSLSDPTIHIEFQNWMVMLPVGVILLALGIFLAFRVDWHIALDDSADTGPEIWCIICCCAGIVLTAASTPYLYAAIF